MFHHRHLVAYREFNSKVSCGYFVTHRDSSHYRISHLNPFPLWMLYSFQLFHHRHLVAYRGFNSKVSCGYCVPHREFTLLHITYGSFPFVNAPLLLSTVPPSASCLLWIQFNGVLWIFCYPSWLFSLSHFTFGSSGFLSLCECSTPFNCSTIGILLPIVDSIHWFSVGVGLLCDLGSCANNKTALISEEIFCYVSNCLDRICLPPSPLRVIKMCLWNTNDGKLGSADDITTAI